MDGNGFGIDGYNKDWSARAVSTAQRPHRSDMLYSTQSRYMMRFERSVTLEKKESWLDPLVSTCLIKKGKLWFLMAVILCVGFLSLEMYFVHQTNAFLLRVTESVEDSIRSNTLQINITNWEILKRSVLSNRAIKCRKIDSNSPDKSPSVCHSETQELKENVSYPLNEARDSRKTKEKLGNILSFPIKEKHGASVRKTSKLSKPSCSALFAGDRAARVASIRYSLLHPHSSKNDYLWAARNCIDFIRNRGYIINSNPEETGFPLAMSILMYKDVEQVERLLRAIYRPSNFYCIHMDLKTALEVKIQMLSIVKCFPNVFLSSTEVNVTWATYSVLEAELVCMRDLLKYHGWKYFINLTGQEFPLKTNLEIVRILKIMNGANSVDANVQRWIARWTKALPAPHGIIPFKGNVHVVVSRGFVDYAINNPVAQMFSEWLKQTEVPDETFFGTLNNNPKLRVPGSSTGRISTDYNLKPYIARFKNWGRTWGEKSFDWPCRGKRVRDICIFGVGDLRLLASRRELFANKFHLDFQPQTYDCMEEWIRNRTIQEYNGTFTMNYEFYKNMPHLKHIYRVSTMK